MANEEDDPIVQEIDVYLAKSLSEKLYLFQYPIRPASMTYNEVTHLAAKIKPKQQKVELEMAIDTSNSNYCRSKGEQIALNVDGTCTDETNTYSSKLMDKQTFCSSQTTSNISRYAAAIYKRGELHLTPLHGILQMRPSFAYLDKADAKYREREAANEHGDSSQDEVEEDVKQITVRFSRPESEQARQRRVQSYEFLQKRQAEEHWVHLHYYGLKDSRSEHECQYLFSQGHSMAGNTELIKSPSEYLMMLVPPSVEEEKEKPVAPSNVLPMAQLRTLPLADQIKILMKNVKVIAFASLMSLLASGTDPTAVLRSIQQNVMEQFNPGLRNLINLGKNYEKAVNGMVLAGRAYYDGIAKIGDIAVASPVSKELGHVLIEISIAQKKLNDKLEENFKKFHKEIISELEKKTELDVKYMNATLKRYQNEHRSKLDSLEKSQAELKKIRRKSQGGRNAIKYEHRESEYLETVSSRQSDIQRFIAEGCREALLEEKKRFCFLVDKHCNFAQRLFHYHVECSEILTTKLPAWLETCSDATKVPATVMNMIDEIKSTGSVSISGTPLPSPMIERNNLVGNNYDSLQRHSPKVPPAPLGRAYTSPLVDMFNNPPVIPQTSSEKLSNATDDSSLLRSTSVATGLNIMKRQKVKTIFPHTAGNNKTLLSFAQGDLITLFVSEERDGWLYGEHDVTKVKGWFPSSYTTPFEGPSEETVRIPVPSPAPTRSVSSVNLTNRESPLLPPPDYVISGPTKPASEPKLETSKTTAAQGESISLKPNMNGIMKPPFLSGENPFATVKLRPTVTNDRSAPILR